MTFRFSFRVRKERSAASVTLVIHSRFVAAALCRDLAEAGFDLTAVNIEGVLDAKQVSYACYEQCLLRVRFDEEFSFSWLQVLREALFPDSTPDYVSPSERNATDMSKLRST